MHTRTVRSDGLLLVAAAIWGFAFVAQRAGMEHVGPFTFNAVRFGLGSCALAVLLVVRAGRSAPRSSCGTDQMPSEILKGGFLAGVILFFGASFQQVGIVYTSAGKAGFITGLYVVIVPLLGLVWGQRVARGAWVGAALAVFGLYMLSVPGGMTPAGGDLLVLASSLFWAIHVLLIGRLALRIDTGKLALVQFATCAVLSVITAFFAETVAVTSMRQAAVPVLYAGLMSVGVGYTLQVVAQRKARPTHAAIILSMESVFAALGGRFALGEELSPRALLGCSLMLAGAVTSAVTRSRPPQLPSRAIDTSCKTTSRQVR